MDENKAKALESVLVQIEKQFGKGSIMKLGQTAGDSSIEVLPTGCLSLLPKQIRITAVSPTRQCR